MKKVLVFVLFLVSLQTAVAQNPQDLETPWEKGFKEAYPFVNTTDDTECEKSLVILGNKIVRLLRSQAHQSDTFHWTEPAFPYNEMFGLASHAMDSFVTIYRTWYLNDGYTVNVVTEIRGDAQASSIKIYGFNSDPETPIMSITYIDQKSLWIQLVAGKYPDVDDYYGAMRLLYREWDYNMGEYACVLQPLGTGGNVFRRFPLKKSDNQTLKDIIIALP